MIERNPPTPYPLIAFDGHKAAAIYRAFAATITAQMESLVPVVAAHYVQTVLVKPSYWARPVERRTEPDENKARQRLGFIENRCMRRADLFDSGIGPAWLPVDEVARLLDMESGDTMARICSTGHIGALFDDVPYGPRSHY